ncbi:TolC family protein [Bythopirellula goksoeyrii]|uniref:Outer membrane channel protein n=1 Tax=Bythopirellula goksoeyrii TaxID=1400387 RepID=A0A5B9QAA0_9BACT|nr:TolC family protein [Bythopirellula goksoeyrii]QEG35808.1 outer membrane channel protein [Bythopirellula goksoeyrii]
MADRRTILLFVVACLATCGCRSTRQMRDREYAQVIQSVQQANYSPVPAAMAVAPIAPDLEGPQEVDWLIQIALDQNPEVQAARKRIDAAAHQVPVAASLPDPMLGVTSFPAPVQTAAGNQELSLSLSQKLPFYKKLQTASSAAESHTNVARAQLAAVELATIQKVRNAYYELYFIQQAIDVTKIEQQELARIRDAANARYKATLTSQQDVLRAEVELSNTDNELIRFRQQLASAQARLARVLHVSPQTKLRAVDKLSPEQAPDDLARLEERAVTARPELHAQLAALSRDRQKAQLARLDYVPDLTLGATWIDVSNSGISPIRNGDDAVLITAGINVPLYRKRIDSSVKSIEAQAVATAREYDALKDGTLEQVADLFAQAQSQQDMLMLLREDILPKSRQTYEVSSSAYSVGQVDFLQLIDNFRELLRFELSYFRLEASLRQTLAELERVIGGQLPATMENIAVPDLPAPNLEQKQVPEEIDPSLETIRLPPP